jgi:hypothetical protein
MGYIKMGREQSIAYQNLLRTHKAKTGKEPDASARTEAYFRSRGAAGRR